MILHPLVTCGLCRACRCGDDVHCENSQFPGINTDGGYAEYLRTTARSVVQLDDRWSRRTSPHSPTPGSPRTTRPRRRRALLRPGTAVVIGAGGLGHIGIQVMKAITAGELVVVDRNPDAVDLAVELGRRPRRASPTARMSPRCWS